MPSPYIKEKEDARASMVGFVELEKGGPMSPTVAEIVSALVRTDQQPWRFDFRSGTLDTAEDWEVVQTGAGQTIDASSGSLVMSTGVTINTETIIRSKRRFTLPVRTVLCVMLSQRIANQEFYAELVNASGNVFARYKFDGTSATAGKIEVASGALNQSLNVAVTVPTTASLSLIEIDLAMDEANFRTKAIDSNTAGSDRATRTSNLPHPDDELYLQFRTKNLGTAPASSTNFSIAYGFVQDVNELSVELVGGRGNSGSGQAVGVVSTGQATGNRIGSVTAQAIWQQISVAAQAAGAASTGAARDLAAVAANTATTTTSYFKEYRTLVWADQPGTLYIEVSTDNVTWRRVRAVPTTAVLAGNNVAEAVYQPSMRYARSVFINGGTPNTAFLHTDAYVSA
jgi:hypothetical protein